MYVIHEVVLKADPVATGYLPFRGDYPGSVRGFNSMKLGHEGTAEDAKKRALSIFPEAVIVEVWLCTGGLAERLERLE
jgi:hypothetical protein